MSAAFRILCALADPRALLLADEDVDRICAIILGEQGPVPEPEIAAYLADAAASIGRAVQQPAPQGPQRPAPPHPSSSKEKEKAAISQYIERMARAQIQNQVVKRSERLAGAAQLSRRREIESVIADQQEKKLIGDRDSVEQWLSSLQI